MGGGKKKWHGGLYGKKWIDQSITPFQIIWDKVDDEEKEDG